MTSASQKLKVSDQDERERDDDSTHLYDVVIVGGGLSGLMVARCLNNMNQKRDNKNNKNDKGRKISWKLFEASSRIGGRLQNDVDEDGQSVNIDLGGAWIWPRHQPVIMRSLVNSPTLEFRTFIQPGDDYASSETYRIVGGAVEFVNRIYDELMARNNQNESKTNETRVQTRSPVIALRKNLDGTVAVELESGEAVRALHAVLAVPPRILSERVAFYPRLTDAKSAAMSSSETWMAGVTKVSLVYKGYPSFWRLIVSQGERLLSPRKRRPAFQVYDGSPFSSLSASTKNDNHEGECTNGISVLTFFTLASLSNDNDDDEVLANDCAEQLCDSLSADAVRKVPVLDKYIRSFDNCFVKRWPLEPYISHNTNPMGITPHPQPIPELAESEWGGALLFAGTETDQYSPGVMEGAVGAAIRVSNELSQKLP